MIVTNDYKFGILNFSFYEKILHTPKAQNRLQQTKNKKYAQKTSKGKKVTYSLVCVLCF